MVEKQCAYPNTAPALKKCLTPSLKKSYTVIKERAVKELDENAIQTCEDRHERAETIATNSENITKQESSQESNDNDLKSRNTLFPDVNPNDHFFFNRRDQAISQSHTGKYKYNDSNSGAD